MRLGRLACGRLGDVYKRQAQGGFVLKMDDRCPAGGADLRHLVGHGILRVADNADDLLTALVAEIDVKIGHTDALGVQESLERCV